MKPRASAYADEEVLNLWWRPRADGTAVAYFRKRVDGADKWIMLGVLEPKRARQIVRDKLRVLGEEELLRRLGLATIPEESLSTCADLITAYRAYWEGTRKDPETCERNILRWLQILREGAGADEKAPLSIWNPDTVEAFEAGRVKRIRAKIEAEKWDAERAAAEMTSSMRTVWGVFRQAKSLFAAAALASKPYRTLRFPKELKRTNELRPGDQSMPQYARPAATIVADIAGGINALRLSDKPLFLAAMVEIITGARVGTAVEAKWAWFVDHGAIDIGSGRGLVAFEIRVAKGGLSVVQVFKEDYEAMLAARVGDGAYIVPGESTEIRREVFVRLADWLRGKGLDRRQPNHELRKLFADTVNKIHGWEAAQNLLGHSDPKLKKHYAEAGAVAPISLLDVIDPRRSQRAG